MALISLPCLVQIPEEIGSFNQEYFYYFRLNQSVVFPDISRENILSQKVDYINCSEWLN